MPKPILCIDFDGVVHDYKHGWGNGSIYGHVVPGFFTWAEKAKTFFKLVIYSSRSKSPDGVRSMQEWLAEEILHWYGRDNPQPNQIYPGDFEFAHEKPPAFLTIDDRAICFDGDWSKLDPGKLICFESWVNKPSPLSPESLAIGTEVRWLPSGESVQRFNESARPVGIQLIKPNESYRATINSDPIGSLVRVKIAQNGAVCFVPMSELVHEASSHNAAKAGPA